MGGIAADKRTATIFFCREWRRRGERFLLGRRWANSAAVKANVFRNGRIDNASRSRRHFGASERACWAGPIDVGRMNRPVFSAQERARLRQIRFCGRSFPLGASQTTECVAGFIAKRRESSRGERGNLQGAKTERPVAVCACGPLSAETNRSRAGGQGVREHFGLQLKHRSIRRR